MFKIFFLGDFTLLEFKLLNIFLGVIFIDVWIFLKLININFLSVRLFLDMVKCYGGIYIVVVRYGLVL